LPIPPGPVSVEARLALPQEVTHLSDLLLAPYKRRRLEGEVIAVSVECPQGRELRRHIGGHELEDPLRAEEVFEMMLAKVTKAYPRWQLITHHLVGG
jgi:hypothetical protein